MLSIFLAALMPLMSSVASIMLTFGWVRGGRGRGSRAEALGGGGNCLWRLLAMLRVKLLFFLRLSAAYICLNPLL